MGRLTQEQWEQARAEYEVRGISLAHGVQITTRRFVGHELFAYRELGRRAIVALSGIQAPKWAYGKNQ